jgi:hypothetical protein
MLQSFALLDRLLIRRRQIKGAMMSDKHQPLDILTSGRIMPQTRLPLDLCMRSADM